MYLPLWQCSHGNAPSQSEFLNFKEMQRTRSSTCVMSRLGLSTVGTREQQVGVGRTVEWSLVKWVLSGFQQSPKVEGSGGGGMLMRGFQKPVKHSLGWGKWNKGKSRAFRIPSVWTEGFTTSHRLSPLTLQEHTERVHDSLISVKNEKQRANIGQASSLG